MPELVSPTTRLHQGWLQARDDWGPGRHEDGFGLRPGDEVDSPAGFAAWVERLTAETDPVRCAAAGRSCATIRWIVEGDQVLGGIALRHALNDSGPPLGHIGYGIRPSARRRGLATWALGQILDEARLLGLDRVQVICRIDNVASIRTIERNGGRLDTETRAVRRYWISVGEPSR